MNTWIRQTITSVPGLNTVYYWARKNYHELRTRRTAKGYFVDYVAYRQALRHEAPGTVDIRTVDGLTITIRRNLWDARILQEIFLSKPYLQDIQVPPHSTIVDIGGYIGDFSLYAVKLLDADKVVVYEPSPKNFAILKRNIANNHYEDRIIAVNMAVSDADSVMMNIDLPDKNQVNVSAYDPQGAATAFQVPSTTLAGLIAEHHLESIDLLKLDCEGGEYPILLSAAPEVLQRIKNIALEFHEIEGSARLLEDVQAKLRAAGYVLRTHDGDIISARRL
jgi:FkbM family methyltransferase